MTAQIYADQVRLLVRAIPEIAQEEIFALKGGTAINLFVRDLPRLSVDIDLVYLPVADRESSLQAVRDGLERVAGRLERGGRMAVERRLLPDGKRLVVQADGVTIKIEVSPVLRGTVFSPAVRSVSRAVEDRFGFAEMQLVSEADLYAGKIAADGGERGLVLLVVEGAELVEESEAIADGLVLGRLDERELFDVA